MKTKLLFLFLFFCIISCGPKPEQIALENTLKTKKDNKLYYYNNTFYFLNGNKYPIDFSDDPSFSPDKNLKIILKPYPDAYANYKTYQKLSTEQALGNIIGFLGLITLTPVYPGDTPGIIKHTYLMKAFEIYNAEVDKQIK